jgi:hypothetical protein
MMTVMNTNKKCTASGGNPQRRAAPLGAPAAFLTRPRPYSIIGNVAAAQRSPVLKSIELTSGAEATDLSY